SKMRAGTEPPPHFHSREHEFMYLLAGTMRVYAKSQVFRVTASECMFLPREIPHAFLIESNEMPSHKPHFHRLHLSANKLSVTNPALKSYGPPAVLQQRARQ